MVEPTATPGDPGRSAGPAPAALSDLRVLELGSMLAGPFVGSLLADFGAEVIKAEKPGQPDALRAWPPHKEGQPLWWKTMARNKRLITIDISRPETREIVLRLIGMSDIVIENFRPGTLERWNLAPAEMKERFPKIVWVRVSGYGQDGPMRREGGYATIAEAYCGLASFTGFPETGPMVSAFPLADYLAGVFGAFGALVATHHRGRGGNGQVVDVSLFEPLLRIIESAVVRYDQLGQKKPRLGNQMEEDVPRNVYPTADGGHVAISCGSQRIFENLADAMGRPELKRDPRFASMSARVANRAVIDGIVGGWMAARTTGEAMRVLSQHAVVAGPVNDIAALFADPHVRARRDIVEVDDPDLGPLRMPAPVPKLGDTPGAIRWSGKAPGADNDYVFRDLLGLDRALVERLSDDGFI